MPIADIAQARRARMAAEETERLRVESVTNAHENERAKDHAIRGAARDLAHADNHVAQLQARAAALSARAAELPGERSNAADAHAAAAEAKSTAEADRDAKRADAEKPKASKAKRDQADAADAAAEQAAKTERDAAAEVLRLDAETANVDEQAARNALDQAKGNEKREKANTIHASTLWDDEHVLALAELHLRTMQNAGFVAEAEAYADRLAARLSEPTTGAELWDAVRRPPEPPRPPRPKNVHGVSQGGHVTRHDTAAKRAARRAVLEARGAL